MPLGTVVCEICPLYFKTLAICESYFK